MIGDTTRFHWPWETSGDFHDRLSMKGCDLSMFVFFQFCCTLTHLGIWLACRQTDAVVLLPVFSLGAKSGASSYMLVRGTTTMSSIMGHAQPIN